MSSSSSSNEFSLSDIFKVISARYDVADLDLLSDEDILTHLSENGLTEAIETPASAVEKFRSIVSQLKAMKYVYSKTLGMTYV